MDPDVKQAARCLSGGLSFEFHYIVGCASDDRAQLFQREHGDVLVLLEGVKRLVVDPMVQQIVLRDAFVFHGLPQWAVVDHPITTYSFLQKL